MGVDKRARGAAGDARNRVLALEQDFRLRPVGTRAGPPSFWQTGATSTSGLARFRHMSPVGADLQMIQLEYVNWRNSTAEGDGPGDLTVRASVEAAFGGTRWPVYFGGKRSVVIEPGARVRSDPVGVRIPRNTAFGTVTYRTHAAGVYFLGRGTIIGLGEGAEDGTTITDKTLAGTITPSAAFAYGPAQILSWTNQDVASAAIYGDSISQLLQEATSGGTATGDANGNVGFIERALGNTVIGVNMSKGGDTIANLVASSRRRLELTGSTCRHGIVQYGANDKATALATLQDQYVAAWLAISATGQRVWQTTITPQSTSTDGWATTVNQTPDPMFGPGSKMATLNDWFRDGAPMTAAYVVLATGTTTNAIRAGERGHPLAGYFEIADIMETGRNTGIIKAGYTADGLHPSTAMHILMAAGIDIARLT